MSFLVAISIPINLICLAVIIVSVLAIIVISIERKPKIRKSKISAQEKLSERLQTSSAETSDQLNTCRNCINGVGLRGTCEDCKHAANFVNTANNTTSNKQNAVQLGYDNANSNMLNNNQLVYTGEISAINNLQNEYSRIDSIFGKENDYSNENED
jgi:hypothetical protein